jgi:hypothetical protein
MQRHLRAQGGAAELTVANDREGEAVWGGAVGGVVLLRWKWWGFSACLVCPRVHPTKQLVMQIMISPVWFVANYLATNGPPDVSFTNSCQNFGNS